MSDVEEHEPGAELACAREARMPIARDGVYGLASEPVTERMLRSWCQDLGRWLVEEISTHGARVAAARLDAKATAREEAAPTVPEDGGVRAGCDDTTARLRRCAAWLRAHSEAVEALGPHRLKSCGHGLPALSRRVLRPPTVSQVSQPRRRRRGAR